MAVEKIFSFLVPAMVGAKDFTAIKGVEVPLTGKLFDLQNEIYHNSPETCKIAIAFQTADDGEQQENAVRSEIINYTVNPILGTAFPLAKRLAEATTKRSKLGLLFLAKGTENNRYRTVISRFPADSAILADDTGGRLNIEFLERVFMKSSRSFKAVMYESANPQTRFWDGTAIDRQVSADDTQIRAYWVQDFLQSSYRTTSAEGTRRLGAALRETVKRTKDPEVCEQIIAAVQLARNLGGQTISGEDLFQRFGLSEKTRAEIRSNLVDKHVLLDTFIFDVAEFNLQVPYRTMRLNNGASMTAPAENFDSIFEKEEVETKAGKELKISTTGSIVDHFLGKQK